MPTDDEPTSLTAQGEGTTVQAALRALLDQLPLGNAGAAGGEERATVIRASATTIEALIPRLLRAMQAAEDDLGLTAIAVTLDGLMKTDEGWRAWATLMGHESVGSSPAPRWSPEEASIEHESRAVTISLTLRQGRNDG